MTTYEEAYYKTFPKHERPTTEDRGESVETHTRPDDGLERMSGAAGQCSEGGVAGSPSLPSEEDALLLEQLDGLVAFLNGSQAYEGVWFGDAAPPELQVASRPTRYWWRSALLQPIAEQLRARLRSAVAREPSEEPGWGGGSIAIDILPHESTGEQPEPLGRELLCQMCGRDYPVWSADSDLWNAVMRGGVKGNVDDYDFVCPTCFVLTATLLGHAHAFYLTVEPVGLPASGEALREALQKIAVSKTRDPDNGPQSCCYCYAYDPDDADDHNEDCPTRIAAVALRGAQETDGS